jgi:hypothetical protein
VVVVELDDTGLADSERTRRRVRRRVRWRLPLHGPEGLGGGLHSERMAVGGTKKVKTLNT